MKRLLMYFVLAFILLPVPQRAEAITKMTWTMADTLQYPAGRRVLHAWVTVDTLSGNVLILGKLTLPNGYTLDLGRVTVDTLNTFLMVPGQRATQIPWARVDTVGADVLVQGNITSPAGEQHTLKYATIDTLFSGSVAAWPAYRYVVGPAGTATYQTIAAAISAAPIGAAIYVRNGVYNEAITMNKRAQRLIGESRDSVVINGGTTGTAVTVTGVNVYLENLTLMTTAGGGNAYHGIDISADSVSTRRIRIRETDSDGINAIGGNGQHEDLQVLQADGYGVVLAGGAAYITLVNARISGATNDGLLMSGNGGHCQIIGGKFSGNGLAGLAINASDFNIVTGIQASSNTQRGVQITGADSDSNVVSVSQMRLNPTANFTDSGNGTVKVGNVAP